MKRRRTLILIVCAMILALASWYLFFLSIRIRQNNASVWMMMTESAIEEHVRQTGNWPTSWEDLRSTKPSLEPRLATYIIVNWDVSVEEIINAVELVPPDQRKDLFVEGAEVPRLLRYSDQVPRDASLTRSEAGWDWWLSQAIYRDRSMHGEKKQ